MKQLVDAIRAFCLAKYEEGYDTCIECWGTEDYVDWIEEHDIQSVSDFQKSYQFEIAHRREIEATAF